MDPERNDAPPGAASRLPAALRTLKHRNFQLFLSGQLISLIGTWLQSVAESWLVYRLTGSSVLLGSMAFAGQIPVFLLAPVGGIVADRFSRRRIIIATQTLSMLLALALAVLTLTGLIRIWHLFAMAALLGLVNAFDIPARQVFVVDMVGKTDLMNAIALNSSMFNASRIVGPAVAGILVASIGEGWCFFANGISYLAVIAGLLMIRLNHQSPAPGGGSALANVTEGFRYVWQTGPVKALLLTVGLVSLMGLPFVVLMPLFADQILHGGPKGLGLLMGSTGIGSLIGALLLAARKDVRGLGRWITFSLAGMGASLILFAYSKFFWFSAGMLLLAGFAIMLMMGASNTLIHVMVPDHLRGRVMAVYSMMFMGMPPVGGLTAGVLAEHAGAPLTVALGGAACILAGVLFAWRLPEIRGEARKIIEAQRLAGS